VSQASPLPVISVGLEFLLDTTVVCEADRHRNKFGPGSDEQCGKLCSLAPGAAGRCTCGRWSLQSARADAPDWHESSTTTLSAVLKILWRECPDLEVEHEELVARWHETQAVWTEGGSVDAAAAMPGVVLRQRCSPALLSHASADIFCINGNMVTHCLVSGQDIGLLSVPARALEGRPRKEFRSLFSDSSFTL